MDTAESGEPEAIEFEQFEGDPIKVAVTGSLPPMDYVAADETPAGFNTAVLVGRALALSQGNVDVVFWTRGPSEVLAKDGIKSMSDEEVVEFLQEKEANYTEEENAIMSALRDSLPRDVFMKRDMPEGTVITVPYYTDLNVLVTLK